MKNTILVPVAALFAGAIGGYISGKNSGSSPEDSAATAAQSRETRSSTRPSSASADASRRGTRSSTSVEEIYRTPGSNNRIQALMAFYSGLTPEQLEAEAAKLDDLPMGERMMASLLLFNRWAEVDPTAAMAYSNTMGFAGGFVRPAILQSWASVDPANAAKYFSENPTQFAMMNRGPMGGDSGASIIATEWARQDPQAALAWASSLNGRDKSQAISSALGEIAKTDPKKATDLLATLPAEDRAGAYGTIASRYGAQDFQAAKAWIASLPQDQQDAALAAAISGLSSKDPALAAREIAAMPAGEAKDRAVPDLIREIARNDPRAASQLIAAQDSERAKRDSMRELMPAWTAQDPAAALAFAQSQTEPEVRDSAVASYIWSNQTANPSELMNLANTIEDDGSRMRAMGATAMRWLQSDPSAARQYIESSDILPAEMRDRILDGGGMWGGGPGGNRGQGRGRGGR